MKVLFTQDLSLSESRYVTAGYLAKCHKIEVMKGNRLLLHLAGVKTPVEVPENAVQILTRVAEFRVDMALVPHGYQANLYVKGQLAGIECRDFGGTHKVKTMVNWLLANFNELLAKMRKEH